MTTTQEQDIRVENPEHIANHTAPRAGQDLAGAQGTDRKGSAFLRAPGGLVRRQRRRTRPQGNVHRQPWRCPISRDIGTSVWRCCAACLLTR